MPDINVSRQIEPEYKISGDFSFSDEDLSKAFGSLSSTEGQELFYNVFSPAWRNKAPEEKWALLARIANLVANPATQPAASATFALPKSSEK